MKIIQKKLTLNKQSFKTEKCDFSTNQGREENHKFYFTIVKIRAACKELSFCKNS